MYNNYGVITLTVNVCSTPMHMHHMHPHIHTHTHKLMACSTAIAGTLEIGSGGSTIITVLGCMERFPCEGEGTELTGEFLVLVMMSKTQQVH